MLQNLKQLYGRKLSACDGPLGWIHDFYFDDVTWTIRYAMVDTSGWLPGRQVLFPVSAFEHFPVGRKQAAGGLIHVNTDRRRIAAGPVVGAEQGFTPELENAFVRHHRLPLYWTDAGPVEPLVAIPSARLHRTRNVTGYRLQALDGPAGTMGSFLLTPRTWTMAALEIETGAWFFGRKLCLRPDEISRIDPAARLMHVNETSEALRQTAGERAGLMGGSRKTAGTARPTPGATVH